MECEEIVSNDLIFKALQSFELNLYKNREISLEYVMKKVKPNNDEKITTCSLRGKKKIVFCNGDRCPGDIRSSL